MNSKWYFSAFVVILALLGINLEQAVVPNQEIIVEFNNDTVSSYEAQNTIASVTQRLQQLGANQIQVLGAQDGRLKITYYSDQDVASVKKILRTEQAFDLDYASILPIDGESSVPSTNDSNSYELNVSEIQNDPSVELEFNGFVVEFATLHDRYVSPDVYVVFNPTAIRLRNSVEQVAYLIHERNSLEIDNTSHNIPEVRAGPIT